MTAGPPERPTLRPSSIGRFFRLQSCPMYLQWEYDPETQELIDTRAWERESLSPVLAGEGDDFERRQLEQLDTSDRHVVGLEFHRRRYAYDEVWTADIPPSQKRLQSNLTHLNDEWKLCEQLSRWR